MNYHSRPPSTSSDLDISAGRWESAQLQEAPLSHLYPQSCTHASSCHRVQ